MSAQVLNSNVSDKKDYIPKMKGYQYAIAMNQLKYHGSINPNACMFFMKMQQEHPDAITENITQSFTLGKIERMRN